MIQARVDDKWPGVREITIPQPLTSVNGNPHIWETLTLCQIATTMQAKTIFEIGTYNGSTVTALSAVPGVKMIWTLDLPPYAIPKLPIRDEDRAFLNMPKPDLSSIVRQLWGDSATFDFTPYAGRCDLVFVMGAHSREYIANDLGIAFQLRSEGGAIVLHPGIAEPMREIMRLYDIWLISDRMAVVEGAK